MKTCESCKYFEPAPGDLDIAGICNGFAGVREISTRESKACARHTEITNGDRLRAMSDEELADFMMSFAPEYPCPPTGQCRYLDTCDICWIEWLKSPAKTQGGENK